MSTKKVINTHGEGSVVDMLKEYKHLDNLTIFGAEDPGTLSKYEKQK